MLSGLYEKPGESRPRNTQAKYLQQDIFVLWGLNVALDSPHVHSLFVCNSCRAVFSSTRYNSGEIQVKNAIEVWVPQDVECKVCTSFPNKSLPGKKEEKTFKQFQIIRSAAW